MAALLRRVLESDYYGTGPNASPYMCQALKNFVSPWNAELIEHIQSKLTPHIALAPIIDKVSEGTLKHRWVDREPHHRKYYTEMIKRLESGDFRWGRYPTVEELGLTEHLKQHRPRRVITDLGMQ